MKYGMTRKYSCIIPRFNSFENCTSLVTTMSNASEQEKLGDCSMDKIFCVKLDATCCGSRCPFRTNKML